MMRVFMAPLEWCNMLKAIVNDFSENTYIIHNQTEAYIIDPGSNYPTMKAYLEDNQLTLKGALLSHGHYDHISGLNDLLRSYDVPIYIHESERDFLYDPNLNLSTFMEKRFKLGDKHHVRTLKGGENLSLGHTKIHILNTPGHTRGGLSFRYKNKLFSGDLLFKETIGRTDLPTGDQKVLIESVKTLLKTYPPNTVVYPGHGHFTTLAHEKAYNPFL